MVELWRWVMVTIHAGRYRAQLIVTTIVKEYWRCTT
jgi:hypothetical protein